MLNLLQPINGSTFIALFISTLEGGYNSQIIKVDKGSDTICGISSRYASHIPYYEKLFACITPHEGLDLHKPRVAQTLNEFYSSHYLLRDQRLSSARSFNVLWSLLGFKIWGSIYNRFLLILVKDEPQNSSLADYINGVTHDDAQLASQLQRKLIRLIEKGELRSFIDNECERFRAMGYHSIIRGMRNRIYKNLASLVSTKYLAKTGHDFDSQSCIYINNLFGI